MKKLLSLSALLVMVVALVACSKDKDNTAHNPYGYNGYNNGGGYGTTPIDSRCGHNGFAGYNYNNFNNGFYGHLGNQPMNNNCISQNHIQGGNPYFFQMNFQYYLGTCDLRHTGRSQLCPPGYQCRQAMGSTGVCMRGY